MTIRLTTYSFDLLLWRPYTKVQDNTGHSINDCSFCIRLDYWIVSSLSITIVYKSLCPSLFEIDAYFFYPFEIAATVPRVLHLSLVGVEKRPEPADPYHLSDKTDPKKGSELSLVGCSELIAGRQGLDCGASNVIRKDSHHQRYGIVWPHLLGFV